MGRPLLSLFMELWVILCKRRQCFKIYYVSFHYIKNEFHLRFWVFSKVHVLNVFAQSLLCWICDCSYSNYYNYANKIFLSIHVLEKIDQDKINPYIWPYVCIRFQNVLRVRGCWNWHVSVSSTLLHVLQALLINRQFLCIIWFSNRWMFWCLLVHLSAQYVVFIDLIIHKNQYTPCQWQMSWWNLCFCFPVFISEIEFNIAHYKWVRNLKSFV